MVGTGNTARTAFALRSAATSRPRPATTPSVFDYSDRRNDEESPVLKALPLQRRTPTTRTPRWVLIQRPEPPSPYMALRRISHGPQLQRRFSLIPIKGEMMKNPLLGKGPTCVVRGARWLYYPYYLRSDWRHDRTPATRSYFIGLRLFRSEEKS